MAPDKPTPSPDPDNLTPFGCDSAFAYDVAGRAVIVMCAAARYRTPSPGRPIDTPLRLHDHQPPPAMADVHWGDPATSSLRYAGQGLAHRPVPEIYLSGCAVPAGGRAVREMTVRLRVGECSKRVQVVGDRSWMRGLVRPRASRPESFVGMPLVYERAYGGTRRDGRQVLDCEPRNPVGRGRHADAAAALDQPLPNLEAPGSRIGDWDDVAEVAGFGPIPAAWQPRLAHAGTYDERWADERAPLWPEDVAPPFFCAAAPALASPQPLRGGEPVVLEGCSVDGVIAFQLPHQRLVAKHYYGDRTLRTPLTLDAVLLEPDAAAVTLMWRCVVPLGHGPRAHLRSVLRLLEAWEAAPPEPVDA
jgi:hypothetical protein